MHDFDSSKTPDFKDDPLFTGSKADDAKDIADQILQAALEELKRRPEQNADYLLMFSLRGADLEGRLLDVNKLMTSFANYLRGRP